ncbi:hypothetical protein ACSSNL_14625 [Thalassobius sp. S69A]|uniref:hypothetical protein n=1 Tax=unclassified Thalassovita TaxID=2619711 RepID=UPI000C11C2B4|nr:hypothetical protein [Paracoccaceae bacterium]MBT25744.1 hypothetical protein [Paracoccaceae bacterium]
MFSKSLRLAFCLTAASLLPMSLPFPAQAQTPLQTAEISAQLFLSGVESEDPILIVAAAKLRKSLHFQQTDRAPISAAEVPPEPPAETAPLGWHAMLDVAAELAAGDDALLGIIDDIRAENTKGVATGQVYSITSIRAGGTDTYPPLPYTGGEYAEVYVEGQAATDLNLYVQDAKGRLVCSDTDISAIAYCGWRPATTEGFTIIVKNKGTAASPYSLITN